MKTKRLLPCIILIISIVATAVCTVIIGISKKPTVTEYDFPFSITYELDGRTETISDVFRCSFDGAGGYNDTKSRIYKGVIVGQDEGRAYSYELNDNVVLHTNMFPDYLMGDPMYDYYTDGDVYEPSLIFYNDDGIECSPEEVSYDAEIISWEYPAAIENSFVFSHISPISTSVVIPSLAIGLITLIAILIFVKRDTELALTPADKLSIALNIAIGIILVPFFSFFAELLNINGGTDLAYQLFQMVPAFTLLCINASVCMRRKGFRRGSLIIQFVPILVFCLIFLLDL